MDIEGPMLSEVSHTENYKYCMITHICGIEMKIKQNKKLIEKEIRVVVTRGSA